MRLYGGCNHDGDSTVPVCRACVPVCFLVRQDMLADGLVQRKSPIGCKLPATPQPQSKPGR